MSRKRKSNKVAVNDAFSNPAARLGFGTMDLTQSTDYPMTRLSQNYELLTSLYRDNWIVQNIVATIPDDIIRKWFILKTSVSPEYIDKFEKAVRKAHLRKKIALGMYWGRLYGGAAGVILIKGQDDLAKPLDLDSIMPDSFLGLQILDRWTGVYPSGSLVIDPEDAEYGLPEYYQIRDEEHGLIANVHHSRVIRFIGRELPWLEQVTEQYWGESEIEAIYNEIVTRDNVSANITGLTFRANLDYMEADGLDQLLGTGNAEMQRRFWNTMQAQSMLESNFGMRILNKGDVIHNRQYTFTGLPEVYDRVMMDVAGAARTPVAKLFGRSAAGLNATGENDIRNYYDYIDGLRENYFREIIEKLLPIIALSCWGEIPDDLDIDFPPMEEANPEEIANITQKQTNAIMSAYQSNLIDAATAMRELQSLSDTVGTFGKIKDEDVEKSEGITFSQSQMMRDPMSGLI